MFVVWLSSCKHADMRDCNRGSSGTRAQTKYLHVGLRDSTSLLKEEPIFPHDKDNLGWMRLFSNQPRAFMGVMHV